MFRVASCTVTGVMAINIIESHNTVARDRICAIENRFQYIRNFHAKSPLLSTYVGLIFAPAASPEHVTVVISEKLKTHPVEFSSSKEELVLWLFALREIESMQLYPSRSIEDHSYCNWAHEWLLDPPKRDMTVLIDLIPTHLVNLIPSELHQVSHARDLLGFLGVTADPTTAMTIEIAKKPSPRKHANVSQAVRRLSEGRISGTDRLDVYRMVLGSDSIELTNSKEDLHPAFLRRFHEIVSHGTGCIRDFQKLAGRFWNRTVLPDFSECVLKLLTMVDPPLASLLNPIDFEPIWKSVFACTLNDADLTILWDRILVSPPDVLVRVVVFSLVEVRDLLEENKTDTIFTIGELIPDFTSILNLAIHNDNI